MRLYGITAEDIEAVLAAPEATDADVKGNARFYATVGSRVLRVVVAKDDPGRVITAHPRRRLP